MHVVFRVGSLGMLSSYHILITTGRARSWAGSADRDPLTQRRWFGQLPGELVEAPAKAGIVTEAPRRRRPRHAIAPPNQRKPWGDSPKRTRRADEHQRTTVHRGAEATPSPGSS